MLHRSWLGIVFVLVARDLFVPPQAWGESAVEIGAIKEDKFIWLSLLGPLDNSSGRSVAGATDLMLHSTFPVGKAETFAWMPDGDHVLLARDGGLDMVDLDGRLVRRVCAGWAWTRSPDVSKDGSWIVFVGYRRGGRPKLWRVQADGSGLTELVGGHEPAIAADEKAVYFEQYTDGPRFYRYEFATKKVSEFKPHPKLEFRPAYDLAIEHDGKWMAFTCDEMSLFQVETGKIWPLSDDRFHDDDVDFASPSDWLMFRRRTRDPERGPHAERIVVMEMGQLRRYAAGEPICIKRISQGGLSSALPRTYLFPAWTIPMDGLEQARFRPLTNLKRRPAG
ncbi:MAG: TolB family protein [Phycisphaerae bacterium]